MRGRLATFALPLVCLTCALSAIQRLPHNLMLTWATCGYDVARSFVQVFTAVVFLIVLFVPKRKSANWRLVSLEVISLLCIPMCVYLAGTWFINNANTLGSSAD